MNFSSNPPPPSADHPSLDTVVTVDNCWYYLSLLEQFVQATQDLPNAILQQYLVRAEYRYFRWISNKEALVQEKHVPPIDVAFFWQAHMLSPLRFYEDRFRVNHGLASYEQLRIPLKLIHEARTNDRNAQINWAKIMDKEPYHLTGDLVREDFTGCATITCIICFVKMDVLWKDYTEWRMDHAIALQCHRCDGMFTVKHAGKANFLFDLIHNRGSAGLLIEESGKLKIKRLDAVLMLPKNQIHALPFNEGLKPLREFIKLRQRVKLTGDNGKKLAIRNRILDAIQSTYLCTPYRGSSLDLIQAVARQYKFARKVTTEINWNMPEGIIHGIRQYSHFLALIKNFPNLTAVPTIAIDLAWHTHMLHPYHYRKFTIKCVGKFINHDDTIPETDLQFHVDGTHRAWKSFNKKEFVQSENNLTSKVKDLLKSPISMRTSKKEKGRVLTEEEIVFKGHYKIGALPADQGSIEQKNTFDREKISYHDERDIEQFVKLYHSQKIMDERFLNTKKSFLGFIGTSNCANTDHLDRWEKPYTDIKEEKALDVNKGKYTYKEVFPSTAVKSKATPSTLILATNLAKNMPYQSFVFEETKEPRPNSAGHEGFNWYQVSRIWAKANKANSKKKGLRDGLFLYNNEASACSSCSGGIGDYFINSACGGGASSCDVTSSGGGGGFSSCGDGSSSCGGGSSSCGGGSSSCGGGGSA